MNFDINNFEINKNYVIDASAGTGKTYTIVEMVKELLRRGITLDKMLIVTYTEKAAGELKDRIRSGIADMDMPDEIKNNPANDVDNASIGTIHSFCQNVINEYFISAGKPSCQKLIDESEIKEFLKRYIRTGEIYEDILKFKKLFSEEQIEDILIEKIKMYIEKYYLDSENNSVSDIISFDDNTQAEYSNNSFWSYLLDGRIHEFPEVKKYLDIISVSEQKNSKGEYPLKNLYGELISSNTLNYSGSYRIAQSWSADEQEAYKYLKEKRDIINGNNKKIKINKQIANYLTYKYIDSAYVAWQKEKENLCAQTYNDMIRNVREEVLKENSKLLKKLRDKYTYAIIDEFQDTNQKQWDIFKTVFMTEGHNLIVVGDPKQSIYSFQGADVTVYQRAKEEIENDGGTVLSLTKNYRASKGIIESTNGFFGNSVALPKEFGFGNSEVGNENYKAQYKGEDLKAFWITENEVSPEEYARIVCNRIVDFCSKDNNGDNNGKTNLQIWDKDGTQRDVSFKDFAVLARTRTEMVPIRNAFEKCGIPYTQYKENELFSGKECANWIAVLEAINAPDFTGNNRAYYRKAMYTYFFGYSFNDIRSSDFDKDSTPEIKMFAEWREIAKNREWAKLIERILVDTGIAGRLTEYGDIKAFGVLLQIGDYCVDYLSKTDNLEMLIKNLRKQSSDDNDEEEDENSGIIAKSTDMDCVKVMTIHASKGLEFPVVISAAGFIGENNHVVRAYTYHDDAGKNYLTFSNNEISEQEATKEYQRLFYVAYTRAKYLLMLPRYNKEGIGGGFVKNSITEYIEIEKSKNKVQQDKCIYDYQPMTAESGLEFDALKESVTNLLSNENQNVSQNDNDIEKRVNALKEFGKSIYFHTSQKHAYSSLSHGGEKKNDHDGNTEENETQADDVTIETEENEMQADDVTIENDALKRNNEENETQADDVTIENDALKRNNEEETENVGLSEYDNSAKVIECDYDTKTPPIELSPNFIAGTGIGNVLHRVFELIDYNEDNADIDSLIRKCFAEEKINCKDEWIGDVKNMVQNVLTAKLPGIKGKNKDGTTFSLKDIPFTDRKNEVEFNFNIPENHSAHHYMNGFVDLIFRRGDYYSVLDWKSDRLNEKFTCYNNSDELKKHVDELYSIQRVLYSYCLIKWLKQIYGRTEKEVFEKHFGGIYYVFLRGCNDNTGNGVYAQTWESFEDLKNEYNNIVKKRVY